MASSNFRAPHSIPQDLLLIHDLIGDAFQPPQTHEVVHENNISSSSDSDTDSHASEDEIEAELTKNAAEDGINSSNVMYVLCPTLYIFPISTTVLLLRLPVLGIPTRKKQYLIPSPSQPMW